MLKDEADANLKAGEALLALGLTDPAASRYYYAMYQSAVSSLSRRGLTPGRFRSGAIEWNHVMVMQNVYLVRTRRSDGALYADVRDLRIQADYKDDSVVAGELAVRVAAVRGFVEEARR
jgi:uncharacterized protein (UPF0332 family)